MKTITLTDHLTWNAGGTSNATIKIDYDENKVIEADHENYEKYIKAVVVGVLKKLGTGEFPFTTTATANVPEKTFSYGGEKIEISLSGDNPVIFATMKKKIEKAYHNAIRREEIRKDVTDMAGIAKGVLDDFKQTVKSFIG